MKFVLSLILIFSVSGFGQTNSDTDRVHIRNGLEEYGVKVISAADYNFDSALKEYTGDQEDLERLFKAFKPLIFFISNKSKKEIAGISLRWEICNLKDETFYSQSKLSSPSLLIATKVRRSEKNSATSLISSGRQRLFSYESLVTDLAENTYINTQFKFKPEETERYLSLIQLQRQQILDNTKSIKLSIDAIVFADGLFVGEDQNFFLESTEGMIKAQTDFINFIKNGQKEGKTASAIFTKFITETLEGANYLPPATRQEAFEQSYNRHLARKKRQIQERREKVADDVLIREVLDYEGGSITKIHRTH